MKPLRRNGYVCLHCRLQSTSSRLSHSANGDGGYDGGQRQPSEAKEQEAGMKRRLIRFHEGGRKDPNDKTNILPSPALRDQDVRATDGGPTMRYITRETLEFRRYVVETRSSDLIRTHEIRPSDLIRTHEGTPAKAKRAVYLDKRRHEEVGEMLEAHASFATAVSSEESAEASNEAHADVAQGRSEQPTRQERPSEGLDAEKDHAVYRPFGYPTGSASTGRRSSPAPFAFTQQSRFLHTSTRRRQQAAAAEQLADPPPAPNMGSVSEPPPKPDSLIRRQLRQWQELHGRKEDELRNEQLPFDADPDDGDHTINSFTRLPDVESSLHRQTEKQDQEERQTFEDFDTDELDSPAADPRFLFPGDLVELEFAGSERESTIAVHIRRVRDESQFLTLHGRWIIMRDSVVQYSITGWASQREVELIAPYLPDPLNSEEAEQMKEEAQLEDISVPRRVSAPLVRRMVQFRADSREIYRKHAGALDNAHDILAHETDLRYGSLVSAATTLLKTTPDNLPAAALFTVRKALVRAGFAFSIDRKSHRYTGYMQIRSKEQVQLVEQVRTWMRNWQDDMAVVAVLKSQGKKGEEKLRRHRTPRSAQYVYDFIDKARTIILKSRGQRDPTSLGNVGPSSKRFPITPESEAVRTTRNLEFTEEDTKLTRFVEAWSCSSLFHGLPRLAALPPLLLQAIGLYGEQTLDQSAGFLLLQEMGTLTPYENKRHFNPHLLLPSSQHSKPLQNLSSSLLEMEHRPDFKDSMQDLRHDWKDLPVYCIDAASAREIDDGLSIERATNDEWWVHIHIANPTGFFQRDHPLAKMARHMGESIYMPERAYVMLPRWATSRHFSLGRDKPCLTISVRMNSDGETLERKITPGYVRNVLRLTPEDVAGLLGVHSETASETVLTVGGDPPPRPPRRSALERVTEEQIEQLRTLQRLAEKRFQIREQNGGVFFETYPPEIEVWQNNKGAGLAWENPYRKGSRVVEGDPIIQMRTPGLLNWFSGDVDPVAMMVREMMLLAGETSAKWCAERQIPAIFRGTVLKPNSPDPEVVWRDIMEPAAKRSPDGLAPVHLAVLYVASLGSGKPSTQPLKHRLLGMQHYTKITSPLRRYGDMIMHWQIQGALREEARTGKSLVTEDQTADRSFLPLSKKTLQTIMLGLQPRELAVQEAKGDALRFWICMLLFRAFHFGECELPFATNLSPAAKPSTANRPPHLTNPNPKNEGKPLPRVLIMGNRAIGQKVDTFKARCIELNYTVLVHHTEKFGLPEPRLGDVWDVELESVNVFYRRITVRPVALRERQEMTEEHKRVEELFGQF